MNSPRSIAIGWTALLIAGGGAFYFAKTEIDSRRKAMAERRVRATEKKEGYQRIEGASPPPHPDAPAVSKGVKSAPSVPQLPTNPGSTARP
ncbi:hypothetical protein CALVIDRAFT_539265 [Calocera viscosa TUFC12733]|uniref:Uncharacterized protein n=1 Tax=Calocera viscosa (strain TUFC12733) TaxID=1330018 RepID=A0A167K3L4_CALVF|nr:hypothetical protein CALVIDRAFT_539265 [Calocera viscosa TUFC12733]